jgi:hypothetical protein
LRSDEELIETYASLSWCRRFCPDFATRWPGTFSLTPPGHVVYSGGRLRDGLTDNPTEGRLHGGLPLFLLEGSCMRKNIFLRYFEDLFAGEPVALIATAVIVLVLLFVGIFWIKAILEQRREEKEKKDRRLGRRTSR